MAYATMAVVTPILNDWTSFAELARRIDQLPALRDTEVVIVAVDDGSTAIDFAESVNFSGSIREVHVLQLNANLGHQRAIALGLAHAHNTLQVDCVVVMDSDGEDRPDDIPRLVAASLASNHAIIVARRARRSEGISFRFFYEVYKALFFLLTGRDISFGSYSLIPRAYVPNVIFHPSIWNNYAATLLRCRVPIAYVPTDRGVRYSGTSSMNFTSLVIHGITAIAVFSDYVISRTVIFLILCTGGILSALALLAILRFSTDIFIPGYATYVGLFLLNMLAGTGFTGFMLMVILLSNRDRSSSAPLALLSTLTRRLEIRSYAMAPKADM